MKTITIFETIGKQNCLSPSDGDKVFQVIASNLDEIKIDKLEVSFEGVKTLSASFLNHAIGQLFSKFSDKFIRSHLILNKYEFEHHKQTVDLVIENSVVFYKKQKEFKKFKNLSKSV